MNEIPWTEKYRPNNFEDIILEENNKILLNNIIDINYFPNLLFYGPPGCGKTTTILNIIRSFQNKNNIKNNSSIIHLNASDDRGIDVIRNNIFNFIKTNNLFDCDYKFIILDEVDYMTKSAQQALKYIIQMYNKKICYCLICNYISKIDYSLQNEFIKLRFNNLPTNNILNLMNNIIVNENLNLSKTILKSIITYYNNDVRCMINYLQTNISKKVSVLGNNYLYKLYIYNTNKQFNKFVNYINIIENKCNIDKFYILKQYVYFILKNIYIDINVEKIKNYEFCFHNFEYNDNIVKYIYYLTIS